MHAPVYITQQSSLYTHKFICFVMNFFIEVHCACIHYHSHTYIRHRDIASLLLRHMSMPKNTPRVCTLVLSFQRVLCTVFNGVGPEDVSEVYNNNNTQKAAIASPPSATHPQLWAELHIHVHVSIQECTLSHLHLHPQVHAHASTHTLHAATDTLHA